MTEAALKETCLQPYPAGSVLVAMYGGYNQIGRTGLLTKSAAVNQAITAVRPKQGQLDSGYLLRVLNFRVDYWKAVASSSRKDPNITSKDVRAFPLAAPALEEQRAIAIALADTDALIESLVQLLSKKRQIKQGAMLELLTGRTRLPGFNSEWECRRLSELAEMGSGGTPPSDIFAYFDGTIPWVSISDMTDGGKFIYRTEKKLSALGLANSAAQLFPAGTVLYAMYASIGECSIARIDLCTSQAILGIRPRSVLDSNFLYYILNARKATVKALGQQGTQANLNKAIVQSFEIHLPARAEQTAIATVLSDMDTEITALAGRLTKARQLKQGMAQALLTGRIRLG